MVSFQVPVGSEVINFLNFMLSDIILIAAVMFLSAKIAGLLNSTRVRGGERMKLKPFDLPHVGGGMVMNNGWQRSLIALLRVSAILAVCLGNFGLQGRSEMSFTSKLTSVRVPGTVEDFDSMLLFNVTEIRMRCAQLQGDQLVFGSVIENRCFLDLREHAFVRSLSMGIANVTREIVIRRCTREIFQRRYYTLLRCGDIDLSCPGPFFNSPDEFDIDTRLCQAVVYDGSTSWSCSADARRSFDPTFQGSQTVECRMLGAQKKDIEHWKYLFRLRTKDPLVAIFGSAYGQERMMNIDVPVETRSVTIFTLLWIVPVIWLVVVVMSLLICFLWLRRSGVKSYGNDERSLLGLLREASEVIHDVTDESDGINGI